MVPTNRLHNPMVSRAGLLTAWRVGVNWTNEFPTVVSTFSFLTKPYLPKDKLQSLQDVTAKHKDTCTSPSFYLVDQGNFMSSFSAIHSIQPRPHTTGIRRCIR